MDKRYGSWDEPAVLDEYSAKTFVWGLTRLAPTLIAVKVLIELYRAFA